MEENNENSQTNNYSLDKHSLSKKEKQYSIFAIIICCFFIVILLGFIAEAYINQHLVFEFLQYDAFKPHMYVIGSISLITLFIGLFLRGLAISFFTFCDFQFNLIVIFLLSFSFVLDLFSIIVLTISYNWQFGFQKILGFILLLLGSTGQSTIEGFKLQKKIDAFNRGLKYIFLIFSLSGLIVFSIQFIQ